MAHANGGEVLQLRATREYSLGATAKKAESDKNIKRFEKNATLSVLMASAAFVLLILCPRPLRKQQDNIVLDAIIEEQGQLNVQGLHDTDDIFDAATALMPSTALVESGVPKESSAPALPGPPIAEPAEIIHVISQVCTYIHTHIYKRMYALRCEMGEKLPYVYASCRLSSLIFNVRKADQGRCGSKMMMHTLHVAGIQKQPFLNHLYPSQFRSLVESRKNLHDAHHKIIFLFGDPIRIVQSVESQVC